MPNNFVTKELTLYFDYISEIRAQRYHIFPVMKQNLCRHSFKNNLEV
jgi:hypothetical protein